MLYRVVIKPSGKVVEVEQGQTILEAALAAGVNWPFGCARGMCGACKARLLEGKVDMGETSSFALFDDERAQGFILTCSSRPNSDVEITFDDAGDITIS
jgi:phenol/toluene 2-monooxygenase (NADH) P5/A5